MRVINLTPAQLDAMNASKNFGIVQLFEGDSVPTAVYSGAQLDGVSCSNAATATTALLERASQTLNGGDEAPAYAL